MSKASHAATFCIGAILATATMSIATPKNDVQRFKTFDAFAQSLALVENNYVDQVDEQTVLRDGIKGMLHNLDVHSTYLPPKFDVKKYRGTPMETSSRPSSTRVSIPLSVVAMPPSSLVRPSRSVADQRTGVRPECSSRASSCSNSSTSWKSR